MDSASPSYEELRQSVEHLSSEFNLASDRAAVIVSVALAEDLLRTVLERFMVQEKATQERFFDPEKPGWTSTLAAMVDLAFLLGLIPDEIRKQIKLMGHVRNLFAHDWKMGTFTDLEKSEDKRVKRTVNQLNNFAPSTLEKEYHPLKQAFGVLYFGAMFGLMTFAMRASKERRTELKFAIEGMGEKEFVESIVAFQQKSEGALQNEDTVKFIWEQVRSRIEK